MLRRDIFNLLFTIQQPAGHISQTEQPPLQTPEYLLREQSAQYQQEWKAAAIPTVIRPQFSVSYAFSIEFSTHAAHASIYVQAEAAEEQNPIQTHCFGIKNGYLFIGDTLDHRLIDAIKLKEGITLLLNVSPQPNQRTHARLQVMDQAGLTLSVLKSTGFSSADWAGLLRISTEITALSITGSYPQEHLQPHITKPNT